jgi:hypothetical protein
VDYLIFYFLVIRCAGGTVGIYSICKAWEWVSGIGGTKWEISKNATGVSSKTFPWERNLNADARIGCVQDMDGHRSPRC